MLSNAFENLRSLLLKVSEYHEGFENDLVLGIANRNVGMIRIDPWHLFSILGLDRNGVTLSLGPASGLRLLPCSLQS